MMSDVALDTHVDMRSSVNATLLPIMAVVFIGFLIIGMALPVLPLHVHHDLGLSTFVVGLVTGSQFLAALVSRVQAGVYADRRGARRAVVVGLVAAMSGGAVYILSLPFASTPAIAAAVLLLGRALIGGAESFIITGGVALGLALAGPQNAGKVIAWVGMAMFAARLFLGHLPDRIGGARIALLSAIIEGVGLAFIWLAPGQSVAVGGALLTGLGYALVYPGLGAEAVSRAPPESRGLAMGAYTAFLDVALGFGSPALGLVADWRGLSAVFLVGATLVLGTALIAGWLLYTKSARPESAATPLRKPRA